MIVNGKYVPEYELDMPEIIRYLADDSCKTDHDSLISELNKHLSREEDLFGGGNKIRDADNIRGPVKELTLAHARVDILDSITDTIGKGVLLSAEPVQALLKEHALWYTRVVLATAWWSHLDSIRQSVLNALMADTPADRERLQARILELCRAKVVVHFTTGEKFYATTEGGNEAKRKRRLEHIQAEYGLENLCLFRSSGDLLPTINNAIEQTPWRRAHVAVTSQPTIQEGGEVAVTLSLE